MNLPQLHELNSTQSTYITFSKSLMDFDKAIAADKKCYFTKMVALNLPDWKFSTTPSEKFYLDLHAKILDEVAPIPAANVNLTFPKAIQYYMENLIRQSIGVNGQVIEEITELAFWKMLNYMGLSESRYKSTVTFINEIATSNFISTENNNGWNEIVCQIPNKCKLLTPAWRNVQNVNDVVATLDDLCLTDNDGTKQFNFIDPLSNTGLKSVIDFNNLTFDSLTVSQFDFNVLLLFYTDETGIQKLHGINFIYPFVSKTTYFELPRFTQKTNVGQTIGYQFKFNQKSCINNATQLQVTELQEHTHWNTFAETLGKLNSFLEINMRNQQII